MKARAKNGEKPKNKAHKQTTMAASPGAGIEAMWSYCSKKEERVNGELREVVRCLFCDDKLSNTATRIEEHLTGLRLRNGVLEEIKKPCASVAPDLKEAMVARKKQLCGATEGSRRKGPPTISFSARRR